MNKQLKQLEHFIKADGKDCRQCVHFNHCNWDCTHPSLTRTVTNNLDFDTHESHPIATAVRANGGKCGKDAKLICLF